MQIVTSDAIEGLQECRAVAAVQNGDFAATEFLWLRELTHRINNELTSTIGIITVDAAQSDNFEVKLALAGVIEHLYDHARLYRALQMPSKDEWIDATAYLRELCQAVSRIKLERNGIRLVFLDQSVWLTSMQSWKLGMIVSELITNSCRHAFGSKGGTICLELKRRGCRAECRITDDGTSCAIARSGHGTMIVQQLAMALDGAIDLNFGREGFAATIAFQVDRPAARRRRATEDLQPHAARSI
jgi:two-component sensor histidine kinase